MPGHTGTHPLENVEKAGLALDGRFGQAGYGDGAAEEGRGRGKVARDSSYLRNVEKSYIS
jgi:hypothetical protein